ncbi:DUF6653 family protein [Microlunatus soli]|uniref:Uncharacterized protein n=1 Tax=Microlunatus soli TaxID=630515 RepID=A0A1H2A8F1_9ACTN|nr:DUF6653 family protein [Microlunatus soli]SDT42144.1 hypothetical protein SAMN04489812_5741 [Microlunatus soli]
MPTATFARSRRRLFLRHAHPISAWTRWATTPAVLVPLWRRRWSAAIPVAAWMAINPIVTPPVTDDHAFATRAMLGEEEWTTDPRADRGLIALNVVGSACLAAAGLAAWRRRRLPMTVGVAGSMIITLLSWRGYAQLYDRGDRSALPLPTE